MPDDTRDDSTDAVRKLHEEADPFLRGEQNEVVIRLRRSSNGKVYVEGYKPTRNTQ